MATLLRIGVLCGKALKQVRAHTLGPEERAYIVFPNRGRSYSHILSLVLSERDFSDLQKGDTQKGNADSASEECT